MGGGSSKHAARKVVARREKVPKELSTCTWFDLPRFPKAAPATASELEKNFLNWEFNIWLLNPDELVTLSVAMLMHLELPSKFCLSFDNWCSMMMDVRVLMGSSPNPYHNFYHVMDVTQSCFVLLSKFEAAAMLKDIDMFALMVSAIFHDLEHPGTNNLYQINASTDLAIRYNDISVLENHHCAKAFEVVAQPDCNIFLPLSMERRKYLRRAIIALVLATDMSAHFSLKDELDKLVVAVHDTSAAVKGAAEGKGDGVATTSTTTAVTATATAVPKQLEEKEALTLLKSLLHTADISNPAKPWSVSKKWSDLVLQEFLQQGDREKAERLPVSMNCDRSSTAQDELSMNFADFIVAPFFFSLTKLLPKLLPVCKQLESNREQWNTMLMQRLQQQPQPEQQQKEAMEKWQKRKTMFTEKIVDLEQVVVSMPVSVTPRV